MESVSKGASADNAVTTLPLFRWADNRPAQEPSRHRALSPGARRIRQSHPYMSESVANLTAELIGLGQRGDW